MGKKKYYAVKHGKIPGVYETWEECRSQVEGVSNAVFKSFPTREEALCFVDASQDPASQSGLDADNRAGHPSDEYAGENMIDIPVIGPGMAAAYVDGSYQAVTGEYSCGVVLFFEGEEIHISRKGDNEELAQMRNVAGELLGAELAMREALSRGAESLAIYHDYEGIAAWCLGYWKTNKEGTRAYKAYYDSIKPKIRISFTKVKGHSGDKWNDLADELAKEALICD